MTKLETVRALTDSGPQLQIVESVRTLQQAVSLMHDDLKRLPGAVSTETAQALEPLARLRQDVTQVLDAYVEVEAIQRKALDELTQQMSASAAQAFEQKAGKLDATISDLSRSLSGLKSSLSSMEQTAQQVATLPGKLASAQQCMTKAADQLTEAANETRPRLWRQALGLMLAGAVGAMVVATGQVALNRLMPPSDVQQTADWANAIWSKATPKERELLEQIVNRPAN
jgi:ABC-type transporter Mla subunit MlaD